MDMWATRSGANDDASGAVAVMEYQAGIRQTRFRDHSVCCGKR